MNLSEFWGKIVRRQSGYAHNQIVDDTTAGLFENQTSTVLSDFLTKMSKPLKTRLERIQEYEVMADDTIVGSVISMIAEDATQQDRIRNHTVWVESTDKAFEFRMNDWLHNNIYIDDIITDIAEEVVGKGEALLRTYAYEMSSSEDSKKAEEFGRLIPSFFEPVSDISEIVAVEDRGNKIGYYYNSKENSDEKGIWNKYEFIHFCNRKAFYSERYSSKVGWWRGTL